MLTRGVPEPRALRGLSRWPRRPLPTEHLQGSQCQHASVSLCVDPASPQPPARGAARPCKVRKPKPRGHGDVTEASPLWSGTAPESGSHNIQEAPQKQEHQASVLPQARRKPETPFTPGGWSRGTAWFRCSSVLPPTVRPHLGPVSCWEQGAATWSPRARILGTAHRSQPGAPRDVTAVASPGPGAWRGEQPRASETS